MASKMPRWSTVKVNVHEDIGRKRDSRKEKEKYRKACKKEGIHPLTCVINQLENVKVDLSQQRIGPTQTKAVVITLLKNDIASSINLRENGLGDEGVMWITELIVHNTSITRLNLSENNIGIHGLKALVSALAENILVTKVDISSNNITDEGAMVIAELLETRTGILELRANHNNIGEKGAIPIGTALSDNDTLELLDLSWNHIRGKGAIAIANSLKTNTCLRVLHVAWNGFAREGAKAMGQALAGNEKLRELDITNNRIDANAMTTLMIGLRTNKALETLKIGKNPFNSDVAKHLLLILEANADSILSNIDLTDVAIDEDFAEVLERFSGVRHLSVNHGQVVRKIPEKKYEPPPLPPRDPLDMLFEFKYEHGYRTLDLLNKMDKDNSMTIDKNEFRVGLEEMDLEVDDEDINDMMARLDTNKDGEIDYMELVQGEKEFGSRHKRHMKNSTIMKIRQLAGNMVRSRLMEQVMTTADEKAKSNAEKTKSRKASQGAVATETKAKKATC